MSIMELEYLKQLDEANKELQALKRERTSLLRKLKGVRVARIREQTKANARLHNCVETYNSIIQRIADRAAETRADRLDFIFWWLSNNWIESGKMTQSEWEGDYLAAVNAYTERYKKKDEA